MLVRHMRNNAEEAMWGHTIISFGGQAEERTLSTELSPAE